jgi:hypothetical protein
MVIQTLEVRHPDTRFHLALRLKLELSLSKLEGKLSILAVFDFLHFGDIEYSTWRWFFAITFINHFFEVDQAITSLDDFEIPSLPSMKKLCALFHQVAFLVLCFTIHISLCSAHLHSIARTL